MLARHSVLSLHPVEDSVRTRVMQAIAEIEARHDVKVLFACESGSRGWGFASPDSDYDVRFVYVHRLPWYLRVAPGRDVIELPINDELDVSGWELRKALHLLRKSNPTLLEWLDSPVVYHESGESGDRLRALGEACFLPVSGFHHYFSMAKKNFRGYLQGETVRLKKYLYVLRPILAAQWIASGRGKPPMRFAELVAEMVDEPELLDEINRLLAAKMRAGEAELSPRWPHIHAFIEANLAAMKLDVSVKPSQADKEKMDRFLMETILTSG